MRFRNLSHVGSRAGTADRQIFFVLYPFSAPPARRSWSFDQESGRSRSGLPELTQLLTQQRETTGTQSWVGTELEYHPLHVS